MNVNVSNHMTFQNTGTIDPKNKPIKIGMSKYLAENDSEYTAHVSKSRKLKSEMNYKEENKTEYNKKDFGNTMILNPNVLRASMYPMSEMNTKVPLSGRSKYL